MNLWDKVLQHTERRVNPHSFATWFRPTRQERVEDTRLIVRVPTRSFLQAPERNLRRASAGGSDRNWQPGMILEFVCAEPSLFRQTSAVSPQAKLDFDSSNNQLNPRYTFDKFIVGASNQFAHAAAVRRGRAALEILQPAVPLWRCGTGQDASDAGDRPRAQAPQSRRCGSPTSAPRSSPMK